MKKMLPAMILASLGILAACSPADEPNDKAPEEPLDQRSEALCCIDFFCPTDESIITTGCTSGQTSVGNAGRECKKLCGQLCTSSGLQCD
jgi:hypothetical protein